MGQNAMYAEDGFKFVAVYGRRRVGETAPISMARWVLPMIPDYMGRVFEDVCMQYKEAPYTWALKTMDE
jgi:hypothetical protein